MPTEVCKRDKRRRCTKACVNCRRRKERCDGRLPCGRCQIRRVSGECTFTCLPGANIPITTPSPSSLTEDQNVVERGDQSDVELPEGSNGYASPKSHSGASPQRDDGLSCKVFDNPGTSALPPLSRLIQDGFGKFMYIGDAANLSFLQIIRRLVRDSLGRCPFAEDPLGHMLVETAPLSKSDWILEMVNDPPTGPELSEARYLISWYLCATNCVLSLYDESELYNMMGQLLQTEPNDEDQLAAKAILFLVFAIGAQTCPENRDQDAERYFNYGRFMTMSGIMEDSSVSTIQVNVLITMYLLGASRRNAAFMYLGTAVRAAYALGLHRSDINNLFHSSQFMLRERLWKVLRILDLFMSASLGRPQSTFETRDTMAPETYSASNDICFIFEKILTDIYSRRMVSTDVLKRISEHHQQWTTRFHSGLKFDNIQPTEYIELDGGKKMINVGLLHLKESYFWSIMLVTRPFLIEHVSKHISDTATSVNLDETGSSNSPSDMVLAHACVDSAIRTVDLLQGLKSNDDIPKRLPFVVNSLFISALVLGLAQFGDLDRIFPLEKGFTGAQELLAIFSLHDDVARRSLADVNNLQEACASYLEKRTRHKMEHCNRSIKRLFGSIHSRTALYFSVPEQAEVQADQDRADIDGLCLAPVTNTHPPSDTGDMNLLDSLDDPALLDDITAMTDLHLPTAPRTLMFDSYSTDIPLFSTVYPGASFC
ncbi:fungal specific transcription factor domain-containing protein [Fusarium sporotrichioides]|uniref:Fungal specific transcription factor domain-containing protein n=1 Tax=Fusarium sporotrichioides TaxID=5514 RepID=A0A395RL96_FUSSP|nr:fungal specific transcription factor domain-containing protein [Fusarium sporotrichioides]